MKNRMIPGLLLWISMWGVTANAAQSAITCDRECLRGKVTQLLYAFLKHDVSEIPVADTRRVTEDAVEKPLAKVGLVRTVTRLRGFCQDITCPCLLRVSRLERAHRKTIGFARPKE